MSHNSKLYISCVITAGCAVIAMACAQWNSQDPRRFLAYLMLAMVAATLKVRLPGMTGTYSLNFLFILLGVATLSFSEAVLIGAASSIVQCLWNAKQRPSAIQMLFNVANICDSVAVACLAISWAPDRGSQSVLPILLPLAAAVYFLVNTFLVSGVLSLTENKPLVKIWWQWFFWSFPYYLAGAEVAALIGIWSLYAGWKLPLLALPPMLVIYAWQRLYIERAAAVPLQTH